jgi:hypothetical protein
MTTTRNNRWTPAEDNAFRKVAQANIHTELIAAKLNRSVRAIKARAYAIGRVFRHRTRCPPPAKPKCMECGIPFLARTRERFVYYYPTRHIFG